MFVPALNYGATETLIHAVGLNSEHGLWRLITSANSVAVTGALMVCVWATIRASAPPRLARA